METLTGKRTGRPVLEEGLRKDSYLGIRVCPADLDVLELASRLCAFRNRGQWAISRLMLLATAVLKQAGIDSSDPHEVGTALGRFGQSD